MVRNPPSAKAVFDEAVEITSPDERRNYLDRACADAPGLRQQIEALLAAYADAGSFLETPPDPPRDGMDMQPAAERPGTMIGPYQLVEQIGEGGMGVVWMAEQTHPVRRQVALKVIKPGMDSKQVVARFEAERQALAVMDHVNIARVLDGGATAAGLPFFVMELVHGVPITKFCDDNRLTPRERLELFVPVCQAIQHAHQKGIIHRDIKPSNVLVTLNDGRPVPKVIDFGVAKATEQKLSDRTSFTQYGTLVGTLEYMSPEQAEMSAQGVDTRSDIFSLGVLLYEILTGSTPLTRERMKQAAHAELLHLIKEEEPPKPSTRLSDSGDALASISANRHTEPAKLTKLMRGDLDWIVMKCLEKDRNRRYETANGFAMDVQRYLADEPVQACPPSAGYRLRKFVRRNRGPVLAGGLVLLAVIAGVIGTSISTVLLWREKERTTAAFDRAEANLDLALNALDQIYVDEAEGHPELREGLPHDLLKRGLGFYQEFARENAHNKDMAFSMGRAHYRASLIFRGLGQEDLAKEALDRAISNNREAIWLKPDFVDAHCNLGIALRAKGDTDGAIASAREAIRLKPDFAEGHGILGRALLDKGDPDGAIASLREAIRLEPNLAKAHCCLGDSLLDKGDPDGAIVSCREAIRLKPNFVEAHCSLGRALSRKGDTDGAIASFREAIRLKPDYAKAHGNLGGVLFLEGDPDGAIASLRKTIQLKPGDALVHNNLGIALLAKGDTDGAIASHREAIRLKPDYAEAHYELGNALRRQGDPDGAIAEYREAIRLEPDYAEAHGNLGAVLLLKGDLDGAIASFRETIRLEPGDARGHYNLGNALGHKGDSNGEIASYREAIRLEPDRAPAHCNLGLALMRQGHFQEALPCLRRGHELGSKRPDWAHPSKEWVEKAERKAELEGRLDQVRSGEIRPRDALERIELAELLYAKSRHAESARMYVEAFTEDAALAEVHRYNAACSASLEAARGGPDAADWRGRALEWLNADLAEREKTPSGLAATLEHWKQDRDLAAVRASLDELPQPEREAWRSLWAAVDRALAAAHPAAK
ncbi:MAG TPA: tetratricopeptide repeat protein [Planctomycetota bacterium]